MGRKNRVVRALVQKFKCRCGVACEVESNNPECGCPVYKCPKCELRYRFHSHTTPKLRAR